MITGATTKLIAKVMIIMNDFIPYLSPLKFHLPNKNDKAPFYFLTSLKAKKDPKMKLMIAH